ncbi:MAG: DUF362 domain-containing protein [Prevotellaceae bacterium]|jgi:hypothetical protein|nr:DUF362 domain-containing protein [Prevotellaceae bacterium]
MKIYDKFIAFLAKIANQKSIFILTGIASTLWFLLRVIPKPQRATYPCMRAAAPLMSAFVCYILSFFGILGSFKLLKLNLKRAKYVPALACVGVFVLALVVFNVQSTRESWAEDRSTSEVSGINLKTDAELIAEHTNSGFNAVMGTAKGITGAEGRVAWVWNNNATWNSLHEQKNATTGDYFYWQSAANDQYVIDRMFTTGVLNVANQTDGDIVAAWNKIFEYFNTDRASKNFSGDNYTSGAGYQTGEMIFIKTNYTSQERNAGDDKDYQTMNAPKVTSNTGNTNADASNIVESNPFTVTALLRHLVEYAGVAEGDIYIGDPIRSWPADDAEYIKARYPGVHLIGEGGTAGTRTIEARTTGSGNVLKHNGAYMKEVDNGYPGAYTSNYIRQENIEGHVQAAKYIFNLPVLKAHESGGISALAKSFYGCHAQSTAKYYHATMYGYWANPNQSDNQNYKRYRAFVDLMASKYLGQKVVLNIVDALYSGAGWNGRNVKWATAPFNNDYPSSVFMSLDPVALESVCFDFLRGEYTSNSEIWKLRFPHYNGCDDHIHQLAEPAYRPDQKYFVDGASNTIGVNASTSYNYNPDGDKKFDYSLGVHAHWNSATKSYPANSIDLVKILTTDDEDVIVNKPTKTDEIPVYQASSAISIDGDGKEISWTAQNWKSMNFRWLNKGGGTGTDYPATFKAYDTENNPKNYVGMYKYLWNQTNKELYVLAKIKDDVFVPAPDASPDLTNYWKAYDILELFFAPTAKTGDHEKNDNGYAPHITANASYSVNHAIDVNTGGTAEDRGIGNGKLIKVAAVKKVGDYYYWEIAVDVSAVATTIANNTTAKFSMAYNDIDDTSVTDNSRTGQYGSVYLTGTDRPNPFKEIVAIGTIKFQTAVQPDETETPPVLPTCEDKLPDTQRSICATRSGNSISLSLNNSEDYFELIKVTKKGVTTVHYEKDETAALDKINFTNGELPVTIEICTHNYKLIKKFW